MKKIEIEKLIASSQQGDRTMWGPDIDYLHISMRRVGLLQPITVYANQDGTYTIISGHRRVEAAKMCGWKEIDAVEIDPPATPSEEAELLLRANSHRARPEDVKRELEIAARTWQEMPADEREQISARLRAACIKSYVNMPAYKADPDSYEDPEVYAKKCFRPQCEWIREVTGLDVSNRTISRRLKEIWDEDGEPKSQEEIEAEEAAAQERAEKVKRKNSQKSVIKLTEKLIGALTAYEGDSAFEYVCGECIDIVNQVRERLVEAAG